MSPSRPRIIGVTGGIASGKDLVAQHLRDLGAHVVDADQVSRDLCRPGTPLLERLVATWGPGILTGSGELDRAALGRRVFAHPEDLQRLNEITHGPIREEIQRGIAASRAPVVAVVASLLLEAGARDLVDEVWVVAADPGIQRERMRRRDGLTEEEMESRLKSQWPLERKLSFAQVVIDNNGSPEQTRRQVEEAWRRGAAR